MTTDTAVGYIRLSQDGMSLDRQRRDVEAYAADHGYILAEMYNEGKRASGFNTDRPKYIALLDHIESGGVDAVVVPYLSRLSRDRKECLRLLLDVDSAGVQVHSIELGRTVDLDDWALVQQSIRTTTDDVGKRKEIERSKRATRERIDNGYDHGRPPFGLTDDEDGHYWVPDRSSEEYRTAVTCISSEKTATRGNILHDPEIPPDIDETADGRTQLNHFYKKILLLPDRMYTEPGRRIAEERQEFVEQFVNRFKREAAGEM